MARTKHYPPDATIADILPDLADGEAYIRQVLITMRMCQKHYGDAWVRIGVTGKAAAPSYRIDRPDPSPRPRATEPSRRAGRCSAPMAAGPTTGSRRSTPPRPVGAPGRLGMAEMLKLQDGLRRPRGDAA